MDRIERNLLGIPEGVMLENIEMERLLPQEVRGVVEEIAIRYQKTPVEPRLDKETGAIIPEEPGVSIDVEGTIAQIQAAAPGQEIKLVTISFEPHHNSREIADAQQIIAEFHTWFQGSAARCQNISAALRSLNNTLLWPGEVFSFNEVTGPKTPERGYLPAPIILNGAYEVDYGGGVCQVASTLYNAALLAKLPIIERHPHSKPVHYVPVGKDATVNYGYLDMKFKNNRNGPLIIKTALQNGRIYVELRGER